MAAATSGILVHIVTRTAGALNDQISNNPDLYLLRIRKIAGIFGASVSKTIVDYLTPPSLIDLFQDQDTIDSFELAHFLGRVSVVNDPYSPMPHYWGVLLTYHFFHPYPFTMAHVCMAEKISRHRRIYIGTEQPFKITTNEACALVESHTSGKAFVDVFDELAGTMDTKDKKAKRNEILQKDAAQIHTEAVNRVDERAKFEKLEQNALG